MQESQSDSAPRRVITEILWGKLRGSRAVIAPGDSLRVGRTDRAKLVIAHDRQLSGAHFELAYDGERCKLRLLQGAKGLELGGEEVEIEADVEHGDWIHAGDTDFMVFFEDHSPAEDLVQDAEPQVVIKQRVLASLQGYVGSLWAVLDAARDDRILSLLREHVDPYRCLYEGPEAETMADAAPYLVRFRSDSRLLERVVAEGWGRRWGVWLLSNKRLRDVRTHLRRFLMVQDESGEQLYFRYYDPAVLRSFLADITPRQKSLLFADVDSWMVDDRNHGLLAFSRGEPEPLLRSRASRAHSANRP